jgi:hypothetical protein
VGLPKQESAYLDAKYIENGLKKRFQHPPPIVKQNQPHSHVYKTYGAKVQYAKEPDSSVPLDKLGKKFIQEVTGVFIFLARAVDSTMLTPLSALASEQAAPTEKTMQDCLQFLDYAASQDEAIVTYRASNIKLAIHSDASYLSEPKARSRAGGHMFMAGSEEIPINNGAVLNISQIIKAVMSSAAEAELGALFINAKTAVSMRQTLEEMGHPQPRTPHPNRQFHRSRTTHQQDPPQGIEGHGYAIQLATMPRSTRSILILLETRNAELSRLLDQAPPSKPP